MAKIFKAPIDLGGFEASNAGTPTAGSSVATKAYVDALIQGVTTKTPVRAATTVNGTLATAYANGSVIDTVTLATGDRILLKNQTTGSENGIYTVNVSGAPTRATDFDATADNINNALVPVEEGAQADTAWWTTNNGVVVVGTTALTFVQFGGAGTTYTGGSGITVVGSTISIDTSVTARRAAGSVGDGSSTSIDFAHNLGTKDVVAQVYDLTTPFQQIEVDVRHKDTNTVTLIFGAAPTSNQYRVVCVG